MSSMHAFAATALLALVVAVVALRAWAGDFAAQVDLGAVWFTAVGAWMLVALALGGKEQDDEAADTAPQSTGLTA
jgi:hypothetical protein